MTREVTETGHYAAMVSEARHRRRLFDRTHVDWLVICNRLSVGRSVNDKLQGLALSLGFRPLDGCAERSVYRHFFPSGLTAFDNLDETTLGDRPNRAHLAARQEARDLYALLRLPINDRARRRAAARSEWLASANEQLDTQGLLAD